MGLVRSYSDYLELPYRVLEDAQLIREVTATKQAQDARRGR